jgi:hypothetical protein
LEKGIFVNLDLTNKIIRKDTAYEYLKELNDKNFDQNRIN